MIQIPLSSPDIQQSDIDAVVEVLNSRWLSLGPKVEAFETQLARVAGVKHAVVVNSGTSALHLGIKALGLNPGDEVITTPFSFIASANCLLFEGVKPVFVDIDPHTYNIDPALIAQAITPRTRAILAVDVFGQPADWDSLQSVASQHQLMLIEDSAEAIGARYKGRPAGSFGEFGVFAFYPNKQMTTGEGGALLTDSPSLAACCRSLRNQGRGNGKGWLQHQRLGYNFRLSDINCALGISQLARLPKMLAQRAQVAEWYNGLLASIEDIYPLQVRAHNQVSWFVYVVRLGERFTQSDRDTILDQMRQRGVQCSNYFAPIHLQPFYREMGYAPGDFPRAEHVGARTIALPFFNRLDKDQVCQVVEALVEVAGVERSS